MSSCRATNAKPCWTLFFGVKVAKRWGFVQPDGRLIPGAVRKAFVAAGLIVAAVALVFGG